MITTKHYPNRLGIWGWLGGGRWGFERYLYTLHRVTGLALLAYFLLHIVLTSSRTLGAEAWAKSMKAVEGPAFVLHAVNGLRLVLLELGVGVGRPIEPVYPYRTSVHVQRPLAVGAMVLAALVAVIGGLDFFILK